MTKIILCKKEKAKTNFRRENGISPKLKGLDVIDILAKRKERSEMIDMNYKKNVDK